MSTSICLTLCLISDQLTTWLNKVVGVIYHDSPTQQRLNSPIPTLHIKKRIFREAKCMLT